MRYLKYRINVLPSVEGTSVLSITSPALLPRVKGANLLSISSPVVSPRAEGVSPLFISSLAVPLSADGAIPLSKSSPSVPRGVDGTSVLGVTSRSVLPGKEGASLLSITLLAIPPSIRAPHFYPLLPCSSPTDDSVSSSFISTFAVSLSAGSASALGLISPSVLPSLEGACHLSTTLPPRSSSAGAVSLLSILSRSLFEGKGASVIHSFASCFPERRWRESVIHYLASRLPGVKGAGFYPPLRLLCPRALMAQVCDRLLAC